MTHLTDDDLVLYYYAEGAGLPEAREHINGCPVCSEKLDALSHALAAVSASAVPDRDEEYGQAVWARVRPQLKQLRTPAWHRWLWAGFADRHRAATPTQVLRWEPRLALAGGMAVLLVVAFVAGRYWQPASAPQPVSPEPVSTAASPASSDSDARRVLLGSAGGHLERSAMMLLDVVNRPTNGTFDMSADQVWAEDLVAANRLYRQTAQRQGEMMLADVLEELERVLVEISNSPTEMSAEQFQALRKRIQDRGLILKVRVLESQVEQRRRAPATSRVPASSSPL